MSRMAPQCPHARRYLPASPVNLRYAVAGILGRSVDEAAANRARAEFFARRLSGAGEVAGIAQGRMAEAPARRRRYAVSRSLSETDPRAPEADVARYCL